MATLEFDEEGARRVERTYATPDVVAQRAQVLALLAPQPGERVLDIGSGPGYLAASLADAVGPTGTVYGLDPSPAMNAIARSRSATRPWIRIEDGDAATLPYPDSSFDAAVATQVYEYVPDMPRALAELRRVLRAGGRTLVLDTDWDSLVWHTTDRELHRRVIAAWEEHVVHPHLPCLLAGLLRRAGFTVPEQRVVVLFNPQLHAQTFSANMMELIAEFVVGRRGVTAEDAVAWLGDLRARADEGDYLFSLTRYVFLATAT
ncbi:methyltransferase domain-containing protein [Pseudonocardia xinjiangensis]|uniref:Methyltransferase domain-containing protein n=1 Tax=Pseudonocardia xinjiangensis TaxID=75289 RepID=A0ABX1RFU8_9PSEU|nr:methyltransferase domain-containing protein [Pseudonocardia xinjiangensis]NMH79272.1 methyltransferase domain-containing protein [Pseudonocardia xinjiangensis]